ncbi:uncharacterized protein LOC144106803 isoform X1 [Amblyomma americanum]
MSITMVGPYPGPFDRTHYSDSSSDSHKDRSQGHPRPTAPSKPRSQPRTPERSSQPVPHDSVAYSQSDSAAALVPALSPPTYPQPSPSEPSSPKPRIEAIKRRCYELLWQLGAFALVAAVVAVLVVAVLSRGRVHPGAAPLKGANVVSGANATRVNGIRSPSTPTSVTAGDADRPGHSTGGVNRRPRQKPRRHRGEPEHSIVLGRDTLGPLDRSNSQREKLFPGRKKRKAHRPAHCLKPSQYRYHVQIEGELKDGIERQDTKDALKTRPIPEAVQYRTNRMRSEACFNSPPHFQK